MTKQVVIHVSAKIFATVAVVSLAEPGGRVLSRSKAYTPASAYRFCHCHTAGRLTRAWRAISATANPMPDSNTIRARWMCSVGGPIHRNRSQLLLVGLVNDNANCLESDSQSRSCFQALASLRVSRRIWAMTVQAVRWKLSLRSLWQAVGTG